MAFVFFETIIRLSLLIFSLARISGNKYDKETEDKEQLKWIKENME